MDWVVGSERHFHYVFQLSFYEIRFVCGYGPLRVIDELIAYKVVTIRYHHMQNVWIKYFCSGFTNFSCVIFWCKHNYHMVTATNVNLYYLIMPLRVWTFENILYSNKFVFSTSQTSSEMTLDYNIIFKNKTVHVFVCELLNINW
jgi:hypothetical protein